MAAWTWMGRFRARRESPRPHPDAMTLGEHLGELRRRLIISICAVAVGAVVTYAFYGQILTILRHPYCQIAPKNCVLYITAPLQGFALRLNVSCYGGILIAIPVLFYQLWRFVTPGLKANEKKYAVPFSVATALLFAAGATTAYLVFAHALRFLLGVSGPGVKALISPNSYITLILLLMVAFGATFEFPVLLVGLEIAGVLTPAKLSKVRRWAIIGMVAFAAIVTPSSDPFSMLALAIPLLIFYEASIVIGRLLGK